MAKASGNKPVKKDKEFTVTPWMIVKWSLAAILVVAVTLFEYFCPFERLLPAEAIPARGEEELRVHFLDVGQGDAAIVEFPSGNCLVIDAGEGSFEGNNHIYRYLKGLHPREISVVATHADIDHCGGIASVLSAFEVKKLYLPAVDSTLSFYRKMLEKAGDTPVSRISRYADLSDGEVNMACISPRSIEEDTDNDISTVLYLSYGENVFLFTSDISSSREKLLLAEYQLDETLLSGKFPVRLEDVDILKVAHHGSAYSSAEAWLELLRPEVAVISCGAGNPYRHPTAEALERLSAYAEIYRTDNVGDVTVTADRFGYTVSTSEDVL